MPLRLGPITGRQGGIIVRQIFPGHQARALGLAEPLRLAGSVTPARSGEPDVDAFISGLGAVYAYPDGLWVRANMVASVDGAIAVDGKSGGLSGAADRLLFWVLRSLADVVLVGAGTARAENYGTVDPADLWPQLRPGQTTVPPIAVISGHLDLDFSGRLFAAVDAAQGAPDAPHSGQRRTIVLTTRAAPGDRLKEANSVADVITAGERQVTAAAAIDALAAQGYRKILVEGGPGLLGQLIAAGRLDEVCLTISPALEGGHSAGRVTRAAADADAGADGLAWLTLASLIEDDSFLLSRYVRSAGRS
jgi:riboflavin biosynthesis pyrimidine reductase